MGVGGEPLSEPLSEPLELAIVEPTWPDELAFLRTSNVPPGPTSKPGLDHLLREFLEEKPWSAGLAQVTDAMHGLRNAFDAHERKDDQRNADMQLFVKELARRVDKAERYTALAKSSQHDLSQWATDTGSFHVPGGDMDALLKSYEDKAAAAKWRTALGFVGKVLLAVCTVAAIGAAGYAWRALSTPPTVVVSPPPAAGHDAR